MDSVEAARSGMGLTTNERRLVTIARVLQRIGNIGGAFVGVPIGDLVAMGVLAVGAGAIEVTRKKKKEPDPLNAVNRLVVANDLDRGAVRCAQLKVRDAAHVGCGQRQRQRLNGADHRWRRQASGGWCATQQMARHT